MGGGVPAVRLNLPTGARRTLSGMHLEHEDRALLDAIELVIARLVSKPQLEFPVLRALEALHEEVARELRSYAVRSPAPPLRRTG